MEQTSSTCPAASDQVVHLGANIYYWGFAEQKHLLTQGVQDWARDLRTEGLADGFWYSIYDARGPHIYVSFTTSSGRASQVRGYLEHSISHFLINTPSTAIISETELTERHQACRGRALCTGDHAPGLAENNSFLVFDQKGDEYPFFLGKDAAEPPSFWSKLDRLAFWTLESLSANPQRAAIRWIAAVDHAIRDLEMKAADYWHYHVTTLLLGLESKFPSASAGARQWLEQSVGEKNRSTFGAHWERISSQELEFDLKEFVRIILKNPKGSLQDHYSTLRQINHSMLGRLGVYTKLEVPLVLYAWLQNL